MSKSLYRRLTAQGGYPAWICHGCGVEHGRVLEGHMATFHVGDPCGWCGKSDVAVTEPRDYGYPHPPSTGRA